MLCETKHEIATARARNRNGSGLVELGNLRHGNGGKTLTGSPCCSVPTQLGARDAGRGLQGALDAWQHGQMVRCDKPPLSISNIPAYQTPAGFHLGAGALQTCSCPPGPSVHRGFEVRTCNRPSVETVFTRESV